MYKKIIITALVVTVFCVTCFVLVLILLFTRPGSQTIEEKDQLCLPNEIGSLNCGKSTELLHDYLERIIADQYIKVKRKDKEKHQQYLDKNREYLMDKLGNHVWEMKPAAKVTGKEQPPLRKAYGDTDMTPITEWHHGEELRSTNGFVQYGIRYRNGRLVVPIDGTYFIYSNLDFFETCHSSSGIPDVINISIPITHGIFKFNIFQTEETELVSNVQPHLVSLNGLYNSYSSYVSTLAELKAGDELSVKVSNIEYLTYTKDNFFGVNLI